MLSYNKKKQTKSPYLNNQLKNKYILPPMSPKKIEKPSILGNILSGVTHGFSFGAGSELAHQGMKKVFTQEQSNEHHENKFQQELCAQLKDEYNKCILNVSDCQALNNTLKKLCKIDQ